LRDRVKKLRSKLKVDLHIHSNWSDGSMGIPQLIRFAKSLGL